MALPDVALFIFSRIVTHADLSACVFPRACENTTQHSAGVGGDQRLGDQEIRNGELLAAVDLGSNSFHLVVARYEHGELRVIDRLRDSVRLAAGLHADGSLDEARR